MPKLRALVRENRPIQKTELPRREFLQLAGKFDPGKHNIAGWYISEKLDGTRCLWDGGISRGLETKDVPYASLTDPKTGEPKANVKKIATGLWSRYGNPINAPDWFLDSLPACPIDGELWAGRGSFQDCRSAVGAHTPDNDQWRKVRLVAYSSPSWDQLFMTGEIKNANMVAEFRSSNMLNWLVEQLRRVERQCICDESYEYNDDSSYEYNDSTYTNYHMCRAHVTALDLEQPFEREYSFIEDKLADIYSSYEENNCIELHNQIKLPDDEEKARTQAKNFFDAVVKDGGEGCVLRNPKGIWTPRRHNDLLKYKPEEDAEATVIGFVAGEAGKKNLRLGRIGGLLLRCSDELKNVEFELGVGLNQEEQELSTKRAKEWATKHPGEKMPAWTQGKHFKVGDVITFKYRELTDKGVPKEAKYFRHRDEE